jgi:hypothetical protein
LWRNFRRLVEAPGDESHSETPPSLPSNRSFSGRAEKRPEFKWGASNPHQSRYASANRSAVQTLPYRSRSCLPCGDAAGHSGRSMFAGTKGAKVGPTPWPGHEPGKPQAKRTDEEATLIMRASTNYAIESKAQPRRSSRREKMQQPSREKVAALIVPGVTCGTFRVRTGCDRGDRATCGGHHSASGPLRLFTLRPPVVAGGRARGAATLRTVQGSDMERCRGARVRATRAAVPEASPISRRNQSDTDHTGT